MRCLLWRVWSAKRIRDAAVAKETALSGLQRKVDECQARDVIGRLKTLAGVETIDAVRAAIRRSDEMRRLHQEFNRVTGRWRKTGTAFQSRP
jgi:hypothetical protein